jgi:serine/threonine-protein kinase
VKHKQLGYVRAIRVLKETILSENDIKYQKFLEECKLLLRLGNGGHPNIVRISQPRLLMNQALVEMEYIFGRDLNDYLQDKNGFISSDEILKFVYDTGSALSYCHFDIYKFCLDKDDDELWEDDDEGNAVIDSSTEERLVKKYKVIHNDIHSKNIIRKYDGSFVLLDFGLAIQNNTLVKSSTKKGGVDEYKAPEKWEDDGIITEQTDVYSFGILMYEVLTGRVPFVLDNKNSFSQQAILQKQHADEKPPAIELLRKKAFEKNNSAKEWKKDYPDWLEEMIFKCLEKKPEDRFRNGKELFEFIKSKSNKSESQYTFVEDSQKIINELISEKEAEINTLKNTINDLEKGIENKEEIKPLIDKLYFTEIDLSDKKEKIKSLEKSVIKLQSELEYSKKTDTTFEFSDLKKEISNLEKEKNNLTKKIKEFENGNPVKKSFPYATLIGGVAIGAVSLLFINKMFPEKKEAIDNVTDSAVVAVDSAAETLDSVAEIKTREAAIEAAIEATKAVNGSITLYTVKGEPFTYTGEMENSRANGKGKAIYKNGSSYEGDFVENFIHGNGKYIFKDGSYFEGSISIGEDELLNGTGTYYDEVTKKTTKGTFKDSKFIQ